jgi:hypothetical protein
MGQSQTPTSPLVESRSAKHVIEALLKRRVLSQVLRPRWHVLERVAHRIGRRTGIRRHERVDLRGVSSRAVGRKEGRTDDGWVYTAQGQVPAPIAPSMAPATCIVRSSVDVRTHTSSGRGAPTKPRRAW